MIRLKGVTVELTQRTQVGEDPLKAPIYEDTTVEVENVLVTPSSAEDRADAIDLHKKRIVYTLAIPKGDAHDWVNTTVRLPPPFEGVYRTVGLPQVGIEENIPLLWNAKVVVERYV